MYLFKNQLKSEDKEIIEKYLLNVFHESSAQSFTSLYMWRDIHDFCWQEIDGYLCIEGTYRPKQDEDLLLHYAFPPVPATGVYDILKLRNVCLKIKEIFEEAGEAFLIKRLPLPLLPYFQRAFPEAKFVDDRNYYDYLYNLKELAELKGKRLHGKKNHVNYFNRTFDYDVKMYDPSMAEEVLDLVDRINEKRNDSSEDMAALSYERQGMVDVLRNSHELGYMGCGIYIRGRLEAFAVGGRLSHDTISEHIEKANVDYKGLYAAINQQFAMLALEKGFEFVNREEDMGSENLRKAKLSYRPVKLVEKYEMTF